MPSQDDADALPAIAAKSQIPIIADIHFQPRYVFAAAAADAGVPIRIGVNAGSLDPRLLAKHGRATPEALVESALWECSLFEEHGFREIKISVKHHDPRVMIAAYRRLAVPVVSLPAWGNSRAHTTPSQTEHYKPGLTVSASPWCRSRTGGAGAR